MALNVSLQALTQPGSTGAQTISLASNFDPKVIILWASGVATAGTAAHGQMGFGFGTYRGSTVAQRGIAVDSRDASAAVNSCREFYDNALLVLLTSAATGSRDLAITLTSMSVGATSNVIINWTNLHTTASLKVNCLILGGSDITDALAFTFTPTVSVASEDVTVVSGFGQPDLLLFVNDSTAVNTIAATSKFNFGLATRGAAGRSLSYAAVDGNATMEVGAGQRSDKAFQDFGLATDVATMSLQFSLDTSPATTWPADGFQINHNPNATGVDPIGTLALKGTFSHTTGTGVAPITGGLPVIQDLAHDSVPKLALLFGWNLAAATTPNTTDGDLVSFFVGAGDGTTQFVAGMSDDDALADSDANSHWTNTKVIRNYNAAAALQSEADGSISGNNFRLSWNDIDTVAREYQWLTLGDAVGGPATLTADLAATEASDTAALVAEDTLPASLAVTEAEDVAVLTAQDTVPAALAATEASDTAALTADDTMPATLAATESPDLAALAVTAISPGGVTLAATEAPDTAALTAEDTMPASLAATEAVDVAALTAQDTLPASLAATDALDTASLTATVTAPGPTRPITLAATEAQDSAAFIVFWPIRLALAATEGADSLAAAASLMHQATLAATESQDTAAAIAQLQHFMNLAATAAPDTVELVLAGAALRPPEGRTAPSRVFGVRDQARRRGLVVPPGDRGQTYRPRGEP